MKSRLLALVLFGFACLVTAQESEPGGIWTAISAEKNITKKWSAGGEIELRTVGFTSERDRFAVQLGTDYELIKNLKLGISYSWMNVNDDYKFNRDSIRTDFYQNRHRFNVQGTWRFKMGNVAFQFRERFQTTIKDDSDRLKEDGSINTNRINPEYVWRNRLKVSYSKKKMLWTPYVSFETYYLLNEPEVLRFYNSAATDYEEKSSFLTKLRYTVGIEYKITKQHSVELYGMFANERSTSEIEVFRPIMDNGLFQGLQKDKYFSLTNWTNDYVVGVAYNYSF